MEERELLNLLEAEDRASLGGGENSTLSNRRAKNLKYYLGELLGDEDTEHSQVIMNTVAETVDNMLPSLLRIFTSQPNTVMFDPVGPDDIEQAQQDTLVINHIYWRKLPGYSLTRNWLKDGLLSINGIISCTLDASESVSRETYEGLTADELAELDGDDELTAVEQDERVEPAISVDPQTGEAIVVDQSVFDVVYERKKLRKRILIENVRPEYFRVSNDAEGPCLDQSVRFVAEYQYPTRQDLIDFGVSRALVMELNPIDADRRSLDEEGRARDQLDEAITRPSTQVELMQRIEVLNAYPLIDYDDDGNVERRQVMKASNRIIWNEPVDEHPYVGWTPKVMPHEFFGICPADEARSFHEIDTTLVRQMLNNLYLTNEPRSAVWEEAIGDSTLDDLLSGGAGDPIRFARPVGESYATIDTPFVAGQSFPMLEYMQAARKRRTGVGEGVAGLNMEQLKNVQTTVVAQAVDMATMQIEAVAREFAESLRVLFLKMHALMRKHQDDTMVLNLTGADWVRISPTEWRDRENMTIMVGLGTGTREQRLIHLSAVADMMERFVNAGLGGMVVVPQNAYNLGRQFAENAQLPDPDLYFTNPENAPPPPPQADPQADALAQAAAVEAMKAEVEQFKIQLEDMRKNRELDIKEFLAEVKAAELDMKTTTERTKLELESGQNVPGSAV